MLILIKIKVVSLLFKGKVKARSEVQILLRNKLDVRLIVHEEGEEFWLFWNEFPLEIETKRLPLSTDAALVTIKLKETKKFQIQTENSNCKEYDREIQFTECSKNNILEVMRKKLTCFFPGLKNIFGTESSIPRCKNKSEGQNAMSTFEIIIMFELYSSVISKCPIPCSQTSYSVNVDYLTPKSWNGRDFEANMSLLMVSFNSLDVEEMVETLIYDFGSLMTSVGGNLGLFLGFSCFSSLIMLIDWILDRVCIGQGLEVFGEK